MDRSIPIETEACADNSHPNAFQVPLPSAQSLERASRLFRALGETARLRLLAHLQHGPRCVTDLATAEGEELSTISQRLRILRAENIVVKTRRGKHINYALADRHISNLVRNVLEHAGEPWNEHMEEERTTNEQTANQQTTAK